MGSPASSADPASFGTIAPSAPASIAGVSSGSVTFEQPSNASTKSHLIAAAGSGPAISAPSDEMVELTGPSAIFHQELIGLRFAGARHELLRLAAFAVRLVDRPDRVGARAHPGLRIDVHVDHALGHGEVARLLLDRLLHVRDPERERGAAALLIPT